MKNPIAIEKNLVSKTVKTHKFLFTEEEVLEVVYQIPGMKRIERWSVDGKEFLEAETVMDSQTSLNFFENL